MEISKIYLTLFLATLLVSSTTAQNKIGVFVHGFNGSGEKWTVASEAPSNLIEDDVIQGAVILNYKSEELNTETSRLAMLNKFVNEMDKFGSRSNDEWILISHSLGGIVSRALYPEFKQFGFNVTGIINIAGPVQGAAATNVDTEVINQEIERLKMILN